jgi:hypothetical protein
VHADGLNEAVAPSGSPATVLGANDTLCVEPAVKVTVIVVDPDAPAVTVIPPELASV